MALQPKNRQAYERAMTLRTKAEEIRSELLDPAKTFTKDELEKRTEEIRALEARAALAADATPEDEIERQGGADLLKKGTREEDEPATRSTKQEYEAAIKKVNDVFGGPNRYLLRIAQRAKPEMALTTEEVAVVKQVEKVHQRAAIIGDTGDASGGEFLLPLQQVRSIFRVSNEQAGLVQYARQFPVSGRTLRIPVLDQYDAAKTRPMAGIANVTIVGEAQEKPERTPEIIQRLLTVYKYAAYTEIGDEVLADDMTGELASTVQEQVGQQVVNAINEHVTIDGSGAAQPLGALHANNAALLVVNRETSMNITVNDIFAMYAKHTFGGGQSFWLVNRTAIVELLGLTLGNNTLVTWTQSLQGAPTMMLLGLPVIMTDLTSVLGVKGDLALVNGGFYALALRQALTVESSIHYKFRNDVTAYRFFARAGGIPIPTGTFAYKAPGGVKQAEHSPFVVLGDDASS